MSFNNGDEASFFKILLNASVDYLQLPPAFATKYLENQNTKIRTLFLKTDSASKWDVKFVKEKDKFYFMDGWLKFINDNRLQIGDLIVFWLLSPLVFQVVFYSPNGCLKHPVGFSALEKGEEKRSRNRVPESAKSFESDNPFYSVTVKESYLVGGLYVPERFLRRYLLSDNEKCVDCVLEVSDGGKWGPIKCRDYKIYGKLLCSNWRKFRDENQLGVGDVCVLELINEIEKLLKVTILRAC